MLKFSSVKFDLARLREPRSYLFGSHADGIERRGAEKIFDSREVQDSLLAVNREVAPESSASRLVTFAANSIDSGMNFKYRLVSTIDK